MRQDFAWTTKRQQAVQLLAEDRISDQQIAVSVGTSRAQLARWKAHPAFEARRQDIVAAYAARLLHTGIASKNNRIRALNEQFEWIEQIIAERAADESMEKVPGGTTGIVVRQWRQVGSGNNAKIVEEFTVDVGMLKESRETMKQMARETGEWLQKTDGTSGGMDLGALFAALASEPPTIAEPLDNTEFDE